MTYRAITKIDRSFAEWSAKQNMRHSLLFKNCLNESQEDNCRVEITDDGWVSKDIINESGKCVIIKAGLGKGKTQASTDHINENEYDQIIIFTPRRSYARCALDRMKASCDKYDWKLYMDDKKRILQHPYIICQAESLNRLEVKEDTKTLILIDEIEAFLSQLTSVKTHKDNHVDNIETFIKCMNNAKKIICLDAFISQRTLQTMKFLKIPYQFYDYICLPPKRTCVRADNLDELMFRLNTDLLEDKKIYFFCSSITKINEKIAPTLRKAFPEKNIIIYSSDTKNAVNELTNVNETWSKCDIILTTSTITVGCNYDVKNYFHKVYCYASSTSRNYVRDMFQSLYRVRHLIDNELVYCINEKCYGMNLPRNKKDIEDSLKDKIQLIENQYQQQLEMCYGSKTPEWLSELIVYNTFEYNVGIMNIEELFQKYLKECNYIHKVSEEVDIMVEIDFEEFTKTDILYVDIPEMTSSQMKEMRKKKITENLTDMENAMWEKFWFQMCVLELPKEVEQPLWEIYCNFNKGKFRNMCVEKGIEQGTVRIMDLLHCGTYSALNDGYNLRVEMMEHIKSWLGMVNSQQYGYKLTREKLESVLKQFEENKGKIHTVFELNTDRSKKFDIQTCQKLINKVFTKWGFSQLMKDGQQRKRIDGVRVDTTPFIITNETEKEMNIYQYIKPKVVKRSERKVKIHTDGLPPI